MQKIARRALVASGVALLCLTAPAWAQDPMRVRGTVEGMDGADVCRQDPRAAIR